LDAEIFRLEHCSLIAFALAHAQEGVRRNGIDVGVILVVVLRMLGRSRTASTVYADEAWSVQDKTVLHAMRFVEVNRAVGKVQAWVVFFQPSKA
jgi:thiamine monophosphate kinase